VTKETKFRGKRVDGGGWVYGYLYQYEDASFILASETPFRKGYSIITYPEIRIEPAYAVVPETVGQFAGFHDKNNKEIYKGDFLQGKEGEQEDKQEDRYPVRSLVCFHNGSFTAFGKSFYNILSIPDDKRCEIQWCNKGHLSIPDLYYGIWDIEVIGNTSENPELLK
jgi:hypothetical protein